jgi:hypothetical protein
VDFQLGKDLGGVIASLQTWFIARADSSVGALASREIMIAELHGALLRSGFNHAS